MEAENPPAYDEPHPQHVPADRLNEEEPAMPHLFMVQLDIPAEHEAEFNRVYDAEHFPSLSKVPGVLSAARHRLEHSTDPKMARYLALYEVESPAVLQSAAWQKAAEFGVWIAKIRPLLTTREHSLFERIA
jgi:hypothetical protein